MIFRVYILCISLCFTAGNAIGQTILVEEYRFGDFESAYSIAVDQFGDVFISDEGAAVLKKFNLKGELLAEVGGPGWGNASFDQLRGIDASMGIAVYAADRGNRRIVRFDRDLNMLASLSGESTTTAFGYPLDVAASSFETLYILDAENGQVAVVNGFNRVIQSFGGIEAGEGRLRNPISMAQAGNDRMMVLETDRIVVFDLFGNFRFQFGTGVLHDARGITITNNRVAVVLPNAIVLFTTEGTLIDTWDTTRLSLAETGQEFRDIAFGRDFLLLLTERSCILIPTK